MLNAFGAAGLSSPSTSGYQDWETRNTLSNQKL